MLHEINILASCPSSRRPRFVVGFGLLRLGNFDLFVIHLGLGGGLVRYGAVDGIGEKIGV